MKKDIYKFCSDKTTLEITDDLDNDPFLITHIVGYPGEGKTYYALRESEERENEFYFSFKHLNEFMAPYLFSKQYPQYFDECNDWYSFFSRVNQLGSSKYITLYFDDYGERSDKDNIYATLYEMKNSNIKLNFGVHVLYRPWEKPYKHLIPKTKRFIKRNFAKKLSNYKYLDQFKVYSITDNYYELVKEFDDTISFNDNIDKLFDTNSYFSNFVPNWINSCLREPESYNSILYCLSVGINKTSEIGYAIAFSRNKVDKYINSLIKCGLVEKDKHSVNPQYIITHPLVYVWYKYIFPNPTKSTSGKIDSEIKSQIIKEIEEVIIPKYLLKSTVNWFFTDSKSPRSREIYRYRARIIFDSTEHTNIAYIYDDYYSDFYTIVTFKDYNNTIPVGYFHEAEERAEAQYPNKEKSYVVCFTKRVRDSFWTFKRKRRFDLQLIQFSSFKEWFKNETYFFSC